MRAFFFFFFFITLQISRAIRKRKTLEISNQDFSPIMLCIGRKSRLIVSHRHAAKEYSTLRNMYYK